jgi:Asp-tRNA(Asn)/Glu-tRNA(Gln) amidotransferase B subunit
MTDMDLTIGEFFDILEEVYTEESSALLKAQSSPQMVNYVVGKIMAKSLGKISPEMALTITKCIVDSDLPNTGKMII